MSYNNNIVIVLNNDNISFLDSINSNNITIYNMGYPIHNIDNIEIPPAYTYTYAYLYHIIKNYDNINSDIIFCNSYAFPNNNLDIFNIYNKTKFINKYNTVNDIFTNNNPTYTGLLYTNNISKSNLTFHDWFEKYICKYPDNSFIHIDINIIKISKDTIKSNPKQYYIDIFNTIYNLNEELFFLDKAFYYLFFKNL
jgi:hypothetical protein